MLDVLGQLLLPLHGLSPTQRKALAHAEGAKASEICVNPRESVSNNSLRPQRLGGELLYLVGLSCPG